MQITKIVIELKINMNTLFYLDNVVANHLCWSLFFGCFINHYY